MSLKHPIPIGKQTYEESKLLRTVLKVDSFSIGGLCTHIFLYWRCPLAHFALPNFLHFSLLQGLQAHLQMFQFVLLSLFRCLKKPLPNLKLPCIYERGTLLGLCAFVLLFVVTFKATLEASAFQGILGIGNVFCFLLPFFLNVSLQLYFFTPSLIRKPFAIYYQPLPIETSSIVF